MLERLFHNYHVARTCMLVRVAAAFRKKTLSSCSFRIFLACGVHAFDVIIRKGLFFTASQCTALGKGRERERDCHS